VFANLCPTLQTHSCILTHQPIPGGTIPLHLGQYVENMRDAVCRSHHRRCNALTVPPLPPQLLAHLLNTTTTPGTWEYTLKTLIAELTRWPLLLLLDMQQDFEALQCRIKRRILYRYHRVRKLSSYKVLANWKTENDWWLHSTKPLWIKMF
jgi:hypothetical protein